MGTVSVEPNGFCSRCSFRYPLRTLRTETVNNHETSFLVCRECWDPDQPQNHLSELDVVDVMAIKNPRPPLGLARSRSLSGFDPVRGMEMVFSSGKAHGSVSIPVAMTLAINARNAGVDNVYITEGDRSEFPDGSTIYIPLTDNKIFAPTVSSSTTSPGIRDTLYFADGAVFPETGNIPDMDSGVTISRYT